MSAETLRRAASLMRERAEAATKGPWTTDVGLIISNPGPNAKYVADCYDEPGGSVADAAHIASWHPAVALAVAEWLEAKAEQDDKGTCDDPRGCCNLCEHDYGNVAALAVARAYLGEAS